MTSEEQYQQLLQMDRLGVTTGKDQRLLASIAAGDVSIAEAFPATTPAPQSSGPGLTFGGSYTTPAASNAENRFNQLMQTQQKNDVVDDGTVDDSTADTGAAPDETAMNQAFLQMLYNLGLSNLYNNLFTNFQQQQAAVPTLPTQGMLGKPQFGVAPVRRGYLPPQVVPQSSIAQDTGLLQYILNQG